MVCLLILILKLFLTWTSEGEGERDTGKERIVRETVR